MSESLKVFQYKSAPVTMWKMPQLDAVKITQPPNEIIIELDSIDDFIDALQAVKKEQE
jgi:hypothetical protein